MVSHAGTFTIEPSTRLHRQEAAVSGPSLQLGSGNSGNLTLHVGGWYQQQQQVQKPAATLTTTVNNYESAASSRVYEYSGLPQQQRPATNTYNNNSGQKRTHALSITTTRPSLDTDVDADAGRDKSLAVADAPEHSNHKRLCAGQQLPAAPSSGLRITDLLNPAAAAVAAAASAAPALTAAHRMTLPSAMTRSHSEDSKHYYHQLAQLQIQLQQQQQQPAVPLDPMARFVRTATAPTETASAPAYSAAGACAQGIVREALELDKVYETHRQSRLGIDALELCMFYLLRAKSIIQSKQRAARQKKEEQQQQQYYQHDQQQRLLALSETQGSQHLSRPDVGTPPLSPVALSPTGIRTTTASTHGLTSTAAEGMLSSPLDSIAESPITPADSVRSGQAVYLPMDKQQLLGNNMITPLTPQSKRLIAGTTGTLPNSYRTFVATATSDKPVAAVAAAAAHQEQSAKAPATKPKSDVTMCGRRMFVAALMCASKFMYDRSYANKAWNKFTKLPLEQLGDMERGFLNMIDYRLYVDKNTYDKFHRLLARSCMRNGRLMVCDPASRSVSSVGCDNKVNAAAMPMTPLTPPLSSTAADQHLAKAQRAMLAQRLDVLSTGSTAVSTPMVSPGYSADLQTIQIQDQVLRARKLPKQLINVPHIATSIVE
ncbi:PHO85 cyclin-5 [Coemansia pectinata]|uniref:PHO85 cyclin-5 n=1 Tax=Coemansia pectinata TaxID=1052879 RepID=A0A9W8H6Y2_9FUNG|nr:PHO85 cyclin-5 [Coemansia pectinata]